ncbi:MAG: phosphotransferase-like protein [Pseudobdellovibrionaceae bacterium]
MLIYLNGTSSSGKTSIALELQKLIQHPIIYFSIDTILYSLSSEDLEAIMGKRPYRFPINWDSIFSGYFSCVAALVHSGNCVIADCPVHNQKLALIFDKLVNPIVDRKIIKVDSPLSVIEQREKKRGDRAIGVAQRQFQGIHNFLTYDFQVKTNEVSPIEAAQAIFNYITTVR